MKRHPILCTVVILIVVGLLLGITAGDMWSYIIDFCKIGIDLVINWLDEIVKATKDSLMGVIK